MKATEIEESKSIGEEVASIAIKKKIVSDTISENEFIDGLDIISNKMKKTSIELREKIEEMKNVKTTEDLIKLLKKNV